MKILHRTIMEVKKNNWASVIVGTSIAGILLVSIIFIYFRIEHHPIYVDDLVLTIFGIALFSVIGIFGWKYNKNTEWKDCVLEIYDDGWLRMRIIDWFPDIPLDSILKVWFGKKYIKKLNRWKVGFQIYFDYGNKAYVSNVCGGLLKESKDINKVEKIAEYLKNIAEKNREEGKKPHGFYENWIYWLNSEEGRAIKQKRDEARKEAGIPIE